MGVEKSTGTHIIFLDSDCVFTNPSCIRAYVRYFNQGFLACFGAVSARGAGFWYRYQKSNYDNRVNNGDLLNLVTSQNFGLNREVFTNIGGFNTDYSLYGFEDRDLYLRIWKAVDQIQVKHDPQLIVYHQEKLHLTSVCHKLQTAGQYTAIIFKHDHPDWYQDMTYAKLDSTLMKNHMRIFFKLFLKLYKFLFRLSGFCIDNHKIPFLFSRTLVKVVCALAFFKGSLKHHNNFKV
jgi:GT2 family glycosyltransferase